MTAGRRALAARLLGPGLLGTLCGALLLGGFLARAGEPAEKKKPAPAKGEKAEKLPEEEESFDVYLDEDEDADRLLRLAARFAANKKWRACLEKYLECLRLYGSRLTRAGGGDRELYESVAAVVLREMAAAPPEGKELWRMLMGARYAGRLKAARARGSTPEDLEAIARDFAGLEFAASSLLLLGEARYARGDSAGAVAAWRRLLREYPAGDYPRTKVLGRAGLVAAEAGLVLQTRAILAQLRREAALAQLEAGGVRLSLVEEVGKRLRLRGGSSENVVGGGSRAWNPLGGDGSHGMAAARISRPTVLRWRRELPVPAGWRGNQQMYRMMRYGMAVQKSKAWPWPAYHAAARGELVYLAGEMGVLVLRAHDGEVAWNAPKSEKGVATSCGLSGPALAGGRLLARQGQVYLATGYRRTVSSARGASLLVLDHATGKETRPQGAIPSPPAISRDDEEEDEDEREKDEPAEKGEGPDGGGDAAGVRGPQPAEERTLFTGVPVGRGGTGFCGIMRRGTQPEYEIGAFDLENGRLLWRTFICSGRAVTGPSPSHWGGGSGALLSEIGQPPAIAGRSVYVVSNLGAVAALDADCGRVKWLRLYPRHSPQNFKKVDPRAAMFGSRSYTPPDRGTADMWEPCAPILTGGLLLAAPQDCDYLLALDPESGKLVWRAPRVGLRRLIGVTENRVILTGADQVVARDAATGKAIWRRRLGARVIGHGTVGADYIAVSTARSLEVMDLSGKRLFSYAWKKPKVEAGNVLVFGENIYTVSATHINAYCDMDAVTRRLAARAKGQPGAALPRFLAGALELAGGRRERAVAVLGEALRLTRPDEAYAGGSLAAAIRAKLWQCHWQMAQSALGKKDQARALKHLDDALACKAGEELTPRTLLARAACLEKLKRPAEALGAYQELLARYPEAGCERADGSRLRAWLLAKGEVDRLLKETGREVYAPYEQKAAKLLAGARESGSFDAARKLARQYPNSNAAGRALLVAAELAARAGKSDVELRCLRQQVFLGGESDAGAGVRARLALAYRKRGYLTAARAVALQLRFFPAKFDVEGRALSTAEFLAAYPQLAAPPRPAVDPPLEVKWRLPAGGAHLAPGCAGDSQLVLTARDQKGVGRVVAVDAASGKTVWSFDPVKAGLGALSPYQYPGREQVRVDGDAVILAVGQKRAVVDRGTGKLRWKTEVRAERNIYYSGYGTSTQGRNRHSCTDGVLACWETASKVDQLGIGERRRLIRALSVDDGRDLWTLLVAKQEQQTSRVFYHGGRRSDGMGRTARGALVAWTYKPSTYRPKRTKQKTTFMVIDATTGRVSRKFEAADTSPRGMFGERLLCQDSGRRTVAFNLEGKKAWVGTGQWQIHAISEREGKLIVGTRTRSGSKYKQEVAAVDVRGGKLLWKSTVRNSQGRRYYSRYSHYGYRPSNALLLPKFLILAENSSGYSPYNHIRYGGNRPALLRAWQMKGGKQIWQTPFVPPNHTRAAGRRHLACAFQEMEQLDKNGKAIVHRRTIFGGIKRAVEEVKAVRMRTTLRLFDLAGGKAVWQWTETKTYRPKAGVVAAMWYPRYGGGRVTTTAGGLLVTTPEAAVLLGPAQKAAPAPKTPPQSPPKD